MKSKSAILATCLWAYHAHAAPVDTTLLKDYSVGFLQQSQLLKFQDSVANTNLVAPPPLAIPKILSIKPWGAQKNVYTVYFEGGGFVTLSADDRTRPILGYSLTGSPPDSGQNEAFDSLINAYSTTIESAKSLTDWDPQIEAMWDYLSRYTGTTGGAAPGGALDSTMENIGMLFATGDVGPLLSTTWNQGGGWNMYAPAASTGPGGRAYAGCVATAMGQVMKFWAHPPSGVGTRNGYNFALTNYAWDSMPTNTYTSATATLLRHAGAAVDMAYGGGGSGAYTWKAADAYKNYFRYNSNLGYVQARNYTSTNWKSLLRTEIDGGRPVQYEGFGSGGHAFVLDGYNNSDYFHFNFGWSGYGDGWYYLSAINPGNMNFTTNQAAIVGIRPATYEKAKAQTIAGIRTNGDAYVSGDLASLSTLTQAAEFATLTSALTQMAVMDLDGDGKQNDLIGRNSRGYLVALKDFSSNSTWTTLGIGFRSFVTLDVDGDGQETDLVLADNLYTNWTSTNGGTPVKKTSKVYAFASGDFDGSGANDEVVGITTSYVVQKSSDGGETWSPITTTGISPRGITAVDRDGNGTRETIVLFDAVKGMWVLGEGTWSKKSLNMVQVDAVDLDGDEVPNEWLGINSSGIWQKSLDNGATWTTQGLGIKKLMTYDLNQDGVRDDAIHVTSTGFLAYAKANQLAQAVVTPMSAKEFVFADMDGDGSKETVVTLATNGTIRYTKSLEGVWLDNLLVLRSANLNDDTEQNDLVGLSADGNIFVGEDGKDWSRILAPSPLKDVAMADFDGDGKLDDIVGLGKNAKLYRMNWGSSTWDSLTTSFATVVVGDFDADGKVDDFAGNNSAFEVFFSKDWSTLTKTSVKLRSLAVGDFDGDGKMNGLAGLSTAGGIQYSNDLANWTQFAGSFVQIQAGDMDSDGKLDDFVAITSTGVSYYTTDRSIWVKSNGLGLKSIATAVLDDVGGQNDMIGLDSKGNVWMSKDKSTWTMIPGLFKNYVIGDFGGILQANGQLAENSGNTALTNQAQFELRQAGEQLTLRGLSQGSWTAVFYDSQGRQTQQIQGTTQDGYAQITNPQSGFGFLRITDAKQLSRSFTLIQP